ncbi:MAG: histidine phosphatase family protein [Pirellulaceae bacterium]|nr:histidine phosphatase family protein [Pirellulaceae bacterium]
MLEILIIRPGSTAFDEAGRIKGALGIPLSDKGREQAQQLSIELQAVKMDCLYVAPCTSAQQTAEAIGERNFSRQRTLDSLHNLDHGLWQGRLQSEVKRLQPTLYRQLQEDPQNASPPGGETIGDATKRIEAVLSKLLSKHRDGRIGLLIPEPLATIARHALSGGRMTDIWKSEIDSGTYQVTQLETSGQPSLEPA